MDKFSIILPYIFCVVLATLSLQSAHVWNSSDKINCHFIMTARFQISPYFFWRIPNISLGPFTYCQIPNILPLLIFLYYHTGDNNMAFSAPLWVERRAYYALPSTWIFCRLLRKSYLWKRLNLKLIFFKLGIIYIYYISVPESAWRRDTF